MAFIFSNNRYTDKEAVELLSRGKDENKVLHYFYSSNVDKIVGLIKKMGIREDDAKDIFQDVLITFYEQVKAGKFVVNAKVSTYLFTLARNKTLNRLKRSQRQVAIDDIEKYERSDDNSPEKIMTTNERAAFANSILNEMNEDCQKILNLSIFKKVPVNEIAQTMGYKSEQIARNKKYKCLEKLKKIIRNSSRLTILTNELRNEGRFNTYRKVFRSRT